MQLTLLHSESFPIGRYVDALLRESIAPRSVKSLEDLGVDGETMRVVLVDPAIRGNGRGLVFDLRTAIVGVGLSEQPRWLGEDSVYLHLPEDPSPAVLLSGVKRAYQFLYQKMRADQLERQLADRTRELREMSEVGIALSTERNHAALLTMILSKALELSRADAGSLYLLDDEGSGRFLRWKLAQNDSIDVDFEEKVLPITRNSLAGYVAMTGETLVIDDAYNLPPDAEYTINRSFDETNNYLTKSLLVFPMTNHGGDTIGVLQLINRKRVGAPAKLTAATVPDEVIPFDQETVELMRSLSGQAAVAVENNLLYESIERLFEGFVTAAVTAIEQRDPTTSGHSFRVADLTVELAQVIDRVDFGKYREVRFSSDQVREIRYASLLHDFGKVGVREQILVKEKKLYPLQLETIRARFDYVMKSVENEGNKRRLEYLTKYGREGYGEFASRTDKEVQEELLRLQTDFAFVSQSNEPTVLPEGEFNYLQQLARREFDDIRGDKRLLLNQGEAKILSIRKGNLDAHERGEIESHVTHTFNFLQKIPWTKDLVAVPDIAYAHHEKLNGRGYPRKLSADGIPLQSRMMTVSDIYDALTANDRPYKRAVSTDRAIDILRMEVNDGLLDPALVELFVESKVYTRAGVVRT
ncbi:MAG TPA: HD domain-containing phosphohydrolase [Thermoanaerobaculia bacterium]|nr:HD domain-containing phosphohydrolase [Thermoanaerobaculia bacterium]